MRDVLAIILGGGRGTRLFPLTHARSKPAVPIGGKYRLIDIPISSCLHADIRRIFVLTQFNSASLNRHISQTYRLDGFSQGFVDILAAEQTPDNHGWFQGTADAVRQARRHFESLDAEYYLILAGDHLYRMDYAELIEAHTERHADITLAAQPVGKADATQMGIFRFDHDGQIVGFEEKPDRERLSQIGSSLPPGAMFLRTPEDKPFVASMGIYVFSRQALLEVLEQDGIDFGKEIIPAALGKYRVNAFLHRDYWADVGTIERLLRRQHHADAARCAVPLPRPEAADLHQAAPPAAGPRLRRPRRALRAQRRLLAVAAATFRDSVIGVRAVVGERATITRSVLLGADFYETDDDAAGLGQTPRLGIGNDVVIDRVIVDKNARIGDGCRLVNEAGVQEADGDGWHIRSGIIVVPKGAVVRPGTVV